MHTIKRVIDLPGGNKITVLLPADEESKELLKKLSEDEIYYFDYKRTRNYNFHKKLFVLFNVGYKNTKLNLSFERWRKVMTMKAGYYVAWSYKGYTQFEAKSLSYESMSQDEFEEAYERILQVVAGDIGTSNEELEIEVLTHF